MLKEAISIALYNLKEQVDTKSPEQVEKSHKAQQVLKAASAEGVDPKEALKKAKQTGMFQK